MPARFERTIKPLSLLLACCVLHLFVGTTARAATWSADVAARLQGAATGKLFTRGNQPISINGIQTNSGATVLTGATIETPNLIGATVNLGSLGSLDIAPNTKLQLEFARDRTIKVTLLEGCVILRVRQGTYGVINNVAGARMTGNDSGQLQAATLDVCQPKGAPSAIVDQGAAANAGAGAEGGAGVVGHEGLSIAALKAIIAGGSGLGIILFIIGTRGDDPSESS